MSINPNKWIETLPKKNLDLDIESSTLNEKKWINTLPKKKFINPKKIYYISGIFFIIGIITVSVIKNETRNLQKEINSLNALNKKIKIELHQATLDYDVLTSPKNLSFLAKEYLEINLNPYKKSQIVKLQDEENITVVQKLDKQNNITKVKAKISNEIKEKKRELVMLQKKISEPTELPGEIKIQISKKIEKTKNDLKKLYEDPKGTVENNRVKRWAAIQVAKLFFGIPVIPGK